MMVAGESERGRHVVASLLEARHDVVIVDVSMPDVSGHQVAASIRKALPHAKVLALTRHAEKAYVQQMLAGRATGYVLKQTAAE